jgi:hypothetical protein
MARATLHAQIPLGPRTRQQSKTRSIVPHHWRLRCVTSDSQKVVPEQAMDLLKMSRGPTDRMQSWAMFSRPPREAPLCFRRNHCEPLQPQRDNGEGCTVSRPRFAEVHTKRGAAFVIRAPEKALRCAIATALRIAPSAPCPGFQRSRNQGRVLVSV